MGSSLKGKRIALLVTDGFEQIELTSPREALREAGAIADIVSAESGEVRGWNHTDPADSFKVDRTFDAAHADDYDAVVLPGGVVNGDNIRLNDVAKSLLKNVAKANKPIAVICHGGWILASADLVKGKKMTSWPSLADDLRNAGADWVDQEVVVDGNLISSRKPDDLDAFNRALIEKLAA
ncbi:type 1 glutamine amidotransferase [Halopseudomonas nanhaiensis]|uniref:type 1 glutamine amidotransferase domain-containing protein n=1 Tax=Halopseudomonas nanhaiensis TaxID=2830842 RepID=UPI001CBF50DB|nr:type 1 glutamine amidotransferase domain-containing protein [Halopseudomonas nanhaiensis]UAX00043.1 type 1 glutamine amidotransferase [Halopseudomonas nanhaiensis]